jgi:ferrous iron transport protein B
MAPENNFAISIVLWFLAPTVLVKIQQCRKIVMKKLKQPLASRIWKCSCFPKLENSYIGLMGKTIEPAISPLGYDWKNRNCDY